MNPTPTARRAPLAGLLALALLGSLPGARAHETVDAGPVSLEWHTDTNERLQVEADTTLTLKLRLGGRPLAAAECRCTLLLYPGAVSPRVRPLRLEPRAAPDGALEAVITTERAGPYALVVDGRPVKAGAFAPFRKVIELVAAEDVYNLPAAPGGQP